MGANNGVVEAVLRRLDWDLADAHTNELTHSLHPYPAKFIPQLPARLISFLTDPGELVLDPFCGGGTTGLEALRLGRHFIGVDANPVGILLGKVKTSPLTRADLARLDVLRDDLAAGRASRIDAWVPPIPNIGKWYAPEIVQRLADLRACIDELEDGAARNVALAAFVKVASALSYQESETRYVSKPRHIAPNAPFTRFVAELDRMLSQVQTLPQTGFPTTSEFVTGDARVRSSYPVPDETVSLIVTSPPYPNAYDYHLYHRFRLFWLGENPSALRQVEIGSHLKHQAEVEPAAAFEEDMTAVLRSALELLQPGRFCVMVVGDGIYRGERYPTAQRVSEIAADLGFITLPAISRTLPAGRRSVTMAGRRLEQEEILLMRKPSAGREKT